MSKPTWRDTARYFITSAFFIARVKSSGEHGQNPDASLELAVLFLVCFAFETPEAEDRMLYRLSLPVVLGAMALAGFISQPAMAAEKTHEGKIVKAAVCVHADAGVFLAKLNEHADVVCRPPNPRLVQAGSPAVGL